MTKPLSGVRIAVTRPADQSRELAEPLENAGAHVERCPLVRIAPNAADEEMRRAVSDLGDFAWVIFTSVNGVDQFMRLLHDERVDPKPLKTVRIACVGPATAGALRRYGLDPAALPHEYVGGAITEALLQTGSIRDRKVLIARASGGGRKLPEDLRAQGAEVVDLALYRTEGDDENGARLRGLIADGKIDLVTFTSGSAVNYFVDTVDLESRVAVAVIGPSTADVAHARGLEVAIEADPHTIPGLVQAILNYYAAGRGPLEV